MAKGMSGHCGGEKKSGLRSNTNLGFRMIGVEKDSTLSLDWGLLAIYFTLHK